MPCERLFCLPILPPIQVDLCFQLTWPPFTRTSWLANEDNNRDVAGNPPRLLTPPVKHKKVAVFSQ